MQPNKLTQIYAILIGIGGIGSMLYTGVGMKLTLEKLVIDHKETRSWVIRDERKNELARKDIAIVLDRAKRG